MGAMLYVPLVEGQAMMLPAMTPGCVTRARTKRQKVADCPQLLPANTQTLNPEAPAGGDDTKVTVTVGVAVCNGPGLPLKSTVPCAQDQL